MDPIHLFRLCVPMCGSLVTNVEDPAIVGVGSKPLRFLIMGAGSHELECERS
jgi:hypothetical protein